MPHLICMFLYLQFFGMDDWSNIPPADNNTAILPATPFPPAARVQPAMSPSMVSSMSNLQASPYRRALQKPRSSPGLQCEICHRSYNSSAGLNVHMQKHTGKFAYYCGQCQKGFTCKGNYDYHMAKHTGVDFPCNRCTKRFKSQQGLQSHINKEHSSF